jgi:hypothetical protein
VYNWFVNSPRLVVHVIALLACALGLAAPADAQFIFIDVNGDGEADAADVLSSSVRSVDIYLDTNHRMNGEPAACTSGEPFQISSYTFILAWEPVGSSSLKYGEWTDNMGFTINVGFAQAGRDYWTGRAAPYYLAAGKHKLGTLGVTVTGTPVLRFRAFTPIDSTAITQFGSPCEGVNFDNTITLGQDFFDSRGTSAADESPKTAWRTIEDLYR